MIFGAGQTGIITRHVIESTPKMKVVGFLEDDSNKIGKILDGIKIYRAENSQLERLFVDMEVDEVIFTVKDATLERKNDLVDICVRSQVRVRTIPPVEKWVHGELSFNQIKEINIEDLLGREAIKISSYNIETAVNGRRILISGAAGSIGSEVFRQVALYKPESVVLIEQAESPMYELDRAIRSMHLATRKVCCVTDITNADGTR